MSIINDIAYILFVGSIFFILLAVPLYYRHIYILRVLSVLFMVVFIGIYSSFPIGSIRHVLDDISQEKSQEYKQGYLDGARNMNDHYLWGGFLRLFLYGAIGILALFPVSAFRKPKELVKNDKKDESPSQPRDT